MNRRSTSYWTAALAAGLASIASAQQPAAAAPDTAPPPPAVGDVAPDFSFRAITKDGVAPAAARLSDYRGSTVVLWFFIKARTRG